MEMSANENKNIQKPSQAKDDENQNEEILPGYTSIDQFTKDGYKILMEAIKTSNCLPTGRDWNFYNTHDSFTKIVNEEGNTVLKQINYILRKNEIEGNIRNRVMEEKTELMIEANDVILERVANNIDELNGIKKTTIEPVLIQTVSAQLPINGSWNRINNATFSVSSSITSETSRKTGNTIRLLTGKNILRPQKFFKDKIINSSKYPWEPRIKEKPNSMKPLAIFLEETENGNEFSHPYEYELERFTPFPEQLRKEIPLIPTRVEDTPLIEINRPEQVEELVETLRNCKEFAVDLEHHSYRSFMGITCLMQISTREKDYLIDTLALRDKLYLLNEVFTKPSIIKIFHGADMDVQWLQRDLSLYVVNMFDTYHAAKQLGYPGLSLSYLMQKFCKFMPNKLFQLADWRIRPLPEQLKAYAREDTHYLIYIYHMLKNELIDKANGQDNILLSVIKSSTKTCQKRYFKPVLREDSYLDFYRKCKRLFDNRQLYALKELYTWRDQISREEDESTGYVLPNHMLLQISESLPREMQGILACCNPIPPLVRANLLELHQIILRAKEQPIERPILKEDTRARGTTLKISKINVDSPLHCPHDLTKTSEFRDDLPTLIARNSLQSLKHLANSDLEIESRRSIYTVFDTPENSDGENESEATKKLHSFTFLGPFERYKLVKPFIQAEEEKLATENAMNDQDSKENPSSNEDHQTDNRTDEERIESIRKHFLMLSRKVISKDDKISSNQTSSQMEASKKRKRDIPLDMSDYDLDLPSPDTDLQINVQQNNVRKRKSSDLPDDITPSKAAKFNNQRKRSPGKLNQQQNQQKNLQKYKRNKKKQRKKQNYQGAEEHANYQNLSANYTRHQQNQDDLREDNYTDNYQGSNVGQGSSGYQNQVNSAQEHDSFYIERNGSQNNQWTSRGKGGKNKSKKRRRPQVNEQNNDFTPYDYSSVDFRQFQGGAGGTQRQQEFKSTFKGKKRGQFGGNKFRGNKSSTFGNAGRGSRRGR